VTTVAWFHCFAGIAGDMAFGALVDAGADLEEVLGLVRRVPVDGWTIEVDAVTRNGVAGTRVDVRSSETGIVRTHSHIQGLLAEARLPPRVLDRSLAVFARLAEAEGRLHRRPPSQVHFHEVGGIDAIVDVVGTCAGLEVLGVDTVASSPVATGTGMIRSAHGALPNPAPAVVELLRGAPLYGVDESVELTTPTGAAILAALCSEFGPLPAMTVTTTGFGAGARTLARRPNLTQVIVGVVAAGAGGGQTVVELATNLDDATGETIAHAVAAVLAAGALDAWVTPVLMKKGRPGHVLSALADEALAGVIAERLMAETGTLGVRARRVDRMVADRATGAVEVDGFEVRVKVSPGRVKAEHDDAARVAAVIGIPAREVARRAEETWRARRDPGDEPA